MKFLAIFLTLSFLALITYLMLDARSELKGARNQLEFFRHQQNVATATPAPTLAEQELAADFHLVGQRRTVVGRAAFHYVADVDIAARERDAFSLCGAIDHLRQ